MPFSIPLSTHRKARTYTFVIFCFDAAKNMCRMECSITQHTLIYHCIVGSIMKKEAIPYDLQGLSTLALLEGLWRKKLFLMTCKAYLPLHCWKYYEERSSSLWLARLIYPCIVGSIMKKEALPYDLGGLFHPPRWCRQQVHTKPLYI